MILASGARGPGFKSRTGPLLGPTTQASGTDESHEGRRGGSEGKAKDRGS